MESLENFKNYIIANNITDISRLKGVLNDLVDDNEHKNLLKCCVEAGVLSAFLLTKIHEGSFIEQQKNKLYSRYFMESNKIEEAILYCMLMVGKSYNMVKSSSNNCAKRPKEPLIIDDPESIYGSFTDPRDKKVYKTVRVGAQVWMAENLKFRSNYSVDYLDNEANSATYGKLYNYDDLSDKLVPKGWRIPDYNDWDTLISNIHGAIDESIFPERFNLLAGHGMYANEISELTEMCWDLDKNGYYWLHKDKKFIVINSSFEIFSSNFEKHFEIEEGLFDDCKPFFWFSIRCILR